MNCHATVELTQERRSLLVRCVSVASCAAITWQSTPAAIWPQRRSPAGRQRLANSTELPQQRNRKAAVLQVCSSLCHRLSVRASERKLLLYKLPEDQEELWWLQQNWQCFFPHVSAYLSFLQFRSSVNNPVWETLSYLSSSLPYLFFSILGQMQSPALQESRTFWKWFWQ